MTEVEWLRRLGSRVPLKRSELILGIGDDCAIYRPKHSKDDLLFTTDLTIEGVHFRRGDPLQEVGRKALARALSDIAAMGGTPTFFLISLAARSTRAADEIYRGLLPYAKQLGVTLAGGDLSRLRKVLLDVVVCGSVPRGKALRRNGASAGDSIYVSGLLGRAASRQYRDMPEPRLELGRRLIGKASACMDLSDGLSLDLQRLCTASGVAAEISDVPLFPGASLQEALHGGEDYELLFCGRELDLPGVYRIGSISEGASGQVFYRGQLLPALAHDHFA